MYAFWKWLLKGLLDAADVRVIVEVGARTGRNTENLLTYAAERGCVVHAIEPVPGFDVEAWQARHGDRLIVHERRGVDALPEIATADVALLDGDHNWFTVHTELELLEQMADRAGRPFPLALIGNVSWPYGRRDTYALPDAIPPEHRHPYRKASIVFGRSELSDDQGINGGLFNAESEGTPRNGVLTAVEDFLGERWEFYRLELVHGYAGLGVLAAEALLEEQPELRAALDSLMSPAFLHQHTRRLEQVHTALHISFARQQRELRAATKRIAVLEDAAKQAKPAPSRHVTPTPTVPLPLRTAFVGSERMARALEPSCELIRLDREGWEEALTRTAPQGLLVETLAPGEPGAWSHAELTDPEGPLAALLVHCGERGIPSVLWATLDGASLAPFVAQAPKFAQHFVADPDAAPMLAAELEAELPPGVLPFAAQPRVHKPAVVDARDGRPVYVGGWRDDWGEPVKRALSEILEAAQSHGLRIAVPADCAAEFPATFAEAVERLETAEDEIAVMQRAPVVLAFHPASPARTFVPRVVFEALACGAAVLARPNWGIRHHFGDTVAEADSAAEADRQLSLLLSDEKARRRRVARAQGYIELAHTYDHRLATIASSVGLALVPQPPPLETVI